MINENGGKMPDAVGIPEEQLRQAARLAVCKISLEQWWKTCWKWWLLMSAVCIGFTAISAMLPVA